MSLFNRAFEAIIGLEGGYVNHPNDPGGETKYGISKRAYPNLVIKALTLENAKLIYQLDYWEKCKCDQLPKDLALCVFDCAVNQGVNTAIKLLQESLHVKVDGVIGSKTLAAITDKTIIAFMVLRAFRYAETNNFNVFGKGWKNRLLKLVEHLNEG